MDSGTGSCLRTYRYTASVRQGSHWLPRGEESAWPGRGGLYSRLYLHSVDVVSEARTWHAGCDLFLQDVWEQCTESDTGVWFLASRRCARSDRMAVDFIIEGVFTMVVGTLLLFVLPGSPDEPRPLLTKGLITFNKQDQYILRERLVEDDAEKRIGTQRMAIPWKLVRQTVLHYKRWPTLLSSFCVFSTWSPLTTYAPSIYVDLGFNRIAANALAAVGATLALVVVFCFARLSDRTNRRGYCVMLAQVCYLITLIVARSVFSMNSSTSTTALSPNRILTLLRPIVSLVATSFALNFRIMVSHSVRHFLHLRKRCATVC